MKYCAPEGSLPTLTKETKMLEVLGMWLHTCRQVIVGEDQLHPCTVNE